MGNHKIWQSHPDLQFIPYNVCSEINILHGASPEFITLVADLETEPDFRKRAEKAIAAIEASESLKEIYYIELGVGLNNYGLFSIDTWRQLYLLERSIVPRCGDYYTWVQRLKVFYDTFLHESRVNKNVSINGHPVLFRKGTKTNPTNHDKLVYGHGKAGSDFYYFDDTLEGTANRDKMVSVEFKYSAEDSPELGAKKYASGKFLYNSKHLIMYMDKLKKYVTVDYTKYSEDKN